MKKHIHHIIPKHMGGGNSPENLITLSIEEHALAHKELWEIHNKEEDRIAYLALSGQNNMPETKRLAQLLGSKNGADKMRLLNAKSNGEISRRGGKKVLEMKLGIHDPEFDKSIGGKKSMEIQAKLDIPVWKYLWVTDGVTDTRVHPENIQTFLENNKNFYRGRAFKPSHDGSGTKNSIWVKHNGKRRRIKQEQLQEFILLGFTLGM